MIASLLRFKFDSNKRNISRLFEEFLIKFMKNKNKKPVSCRGRLEGCAVVDNKLGINGSLPLSLKTKTREGRDNDRRSGKRQKRAEKKVTF